MRAIILLALAALPLTVSAPSAAACDINSTFCILEHAEGDGVCEGDAFEHRGTAVIANAPGVYVEVMGESACWNDGPWQSDHDRISGFIVTRYGVVYFTWADMQGSDGRGNVQEFCFVEASAGAAHVFTDCPAGLGPPDLPWGELVP